MYELITKYFYGEITAKEKDFIMNNAKYAKKRLVKAFPKLKIK